MGNSQSLPPKTQEFKQLLENEKLESIYPLPSSQQIKSACRKPTKPAPKNTINKPLNAKPTERRNENVQSAYDQRKQVQDTKTWPYSVHGVVAANFKGETFFGTGVMIGPNIVLTAGNNLYRFEDKVEADLKSIQFSPARDGTMLPFGFSEVEKYFVSSKYIEERKEDYGVLILKKPLGEMTGYFGLACLKPNEVQTKTINITGYPRDKVKSTPRLYQMWGMEGEVSHVDHTEGLINHGIDTGPGQSGSGVWYQEGEDYYVCGVHVAGGLSANSATLLTKEVYENIYAWVQESSFKELLLKLGDSKELNFKEKGINAECVSLMIKYNLDGLMSIDLHNNKIGDQGAMILAKNTSWANLSKLDLSLNNISAEGTKALAKNTFWPNLSHLNLSSNNIGAEGVKALTQNACWINLSQLYLSSCNIDVEGVKAIVQNIRRDNFLELNLSGNNIGVEGAKVLAQNTSWVNLSKLDLSLTHIGAEGAKALAQNLAWRNLSHFFLSLNNILAEGAQALAQNSSWTNLCLLECSVNIIGPDGAKALAQNTSWKNLSQLYLLGNLIDADGAKALTQNTSWTSLSQLHLMDNEISEADEEGLGPWNWRHISGCKINIK